MVINMDPIMDFADLSVVFEFDEQSLDYVDTPLSGRLQNRMTREWFAFDCQPVVHSLLWHWTLVPVTQEKDVLCALEEASKTTAGHWLSIVEDRRGPVPHCKAVRIDNSVARPVVL